ASSSRPGSVGTGQRYDRCPTKVGDLLRSVVRHPDVGKRPARIGDPGPARESEGSYQWISSASSAGGGAERLHPRGGGVGRIVHGLTASGPCLSGSKPDW